MLIPIRIKEFEQFWEDMHIILDLTKCSLAKLQMLEIRAHGLVVYRIAITRHACNTWNVKSQEWP